MIVLFVIGESAAAQCRKLVTLTNFPFLMFANFNIYVERKSMTTVSDSSNSDVDDVNNEIDYDTSIEASNETNEKKKGK